MLGGGGGRRVDIVLRHKCWLLLATSNGTLDHIGSAWQCRRALVPEPESDISGRATGSDICHTHSHMVGKWRPMWGLWKMRISSSKSPGERRAIS